MPTYFETEPAEIGRRITEAVCGKLSLRHAVAAPNSRDTAGASSIVMPLVMPTVNMIHSVHERCIQGTGSSPLLGHVREAYQRSLGSKMEPEDDQDFVNQMASLAMDEVVRRIIAESEETAQDRNASTPAQAARTIANRIGEAMRRTRVTLTYDNVNDGFTKAYYVSPTGLQVSQQQMSKVTYEEYNAFISDPRFDIELKGVASEDHSDLNLRGCVLYKTRGGLIVKRDEDGELEETSLRPNAVAWHTLDTDTHVSKAERSEVRSFITGGLAQMRRVPIGKGRQTVTGFATRVTPIAITVDGQDIRLESIVDGPHAVERSVSLLPASSEIVREIEVLIEQALVPAFDDSAFSAETAKRIIDASQQM